VQSVAQFAFQNAILKIESKKKERAGRALFIFAFEAPMGTRAKPVDAGGEELSELRRKISALVAQNAVPMVQQAIDAVREEGQYQAIKYLFEMIGLYPASVQEDSETQDSVAQILLEQLGLTPQTGKRVSHRRTEVSPVHPVE
jgi:hypothetical protein